MTLVLNREGTRQNYTYQKRLPIGVERQGQTMALFIYLNSPPVVAVNSDNRKAMRKEKWHKVKFEKSTKNDSIEFRKQTNKKTKKQNKTKKEKMEIKF